MDRKAFMSIAISLLIVMLVFFPAGAASGSFALEALGVRPLAMGSAFTAIADDVAAVLWNPAGLPQVTGRQVEVLHGEPFQMGITQLGVMAVFPTQKLTYGAAFSQLDESEALGFPYYERIFALGLGGETPFFNRTSWGLTNKLYALEGGSDSLKFSAFSYCLDAGLMTNYKGLRLAAVVRDLPVASFGKLKIDGEEEDSSLQIDPQLRLGAAYALDRWLFSTELTLESSGKSVALGVERKLAGGVILRGGLATEGIAVGFGIDKNPYQVNFAYLIHPIASSQQLSMVYRW